MDLASVCASNTFPNISLCLSQPVLGVLKFIKKIVKNIKGIVEYFRILLDTCGELIHLMQ